MRITLIVNRVLDRLTDIGKYLLIFGVAIATFTLQLSAVAMPNFIGNSAFFAEETMSVDMTGESMDAEVDPDGDTDDSAIAGEEETVEAQVEDLLEDAQDKAQQDIETTEEVASDAASDIEDEASGFFDSFKSFLGFD